MTRLTNKNGTYMVIGQGNSLVGIGIPEIQGAPAPFERVFCVIVRYGESVQGPKWDRFLDTVMPILYAFIAPVIGISSDEINAYQGKLSWLMYLNTKNHLFNELLARKFCALIVHLSRDVLAGSMPAQLFMRKLPENHMIQRGASSE